MSIGLVVFAAEGLAQRPPAQHGALDAGGHVGHIPQGAGLLQLVDLVLRGLTADHPLEQITEMESLVLGTADDHAQHDVRRRLGHGAAAAHEGAVGNDIAVGLQLQAYLIAAAGVDARQLDVGVRQVVPELGVEVVLRQDLVVKAVSFQSPYAP